MVYPLKHDGNYWYTIPIKFLNEIPADSIVKISKFPKEFTVIENETL